MRKPGVHVEFSWGACIEISKRLMILGSEEEDGG
jgi:hypothetical protein